MEGHRPKRQEHVAGIAHGLDVLLEALRRGCHPKLTATVYHNRRARHSCTADAGDKCCELSPCFADVNCVSLASDTSIAYLDIVTARGEAEARIIAQFDAKRTGCIPTHRILTVGCVVAPGCVARERTLTAGRVEAAGCVAKERIKTVGRVEAAGCVAKERIKTGGRVAAAGRVV